MSYNHSIEIVFFIRRKVPQTYNLMLNVVIGVKKKTSKMLTQDSER